MRASTCIDIGLDRERRPEVRRLRCEVPLLVRRGAAVDPDRLDLLLVSGAAGPLGGDELSLFLVVRAGAAVRVRSVAATLLQPDPHGRQSRAALHVVVEPGATLDWEPQPVVSVLGSDHRSTTTLSVAADGCVRLVETISLGRHGEAPGRAALHQRVEHDGAPVLDHEVVLAPGALSGPGAHGPGRVVRSTLIVGPDAPTEASATVHPTVLRGIFPLVPGCALVTETTSSLRDLDDPADDADRP